MFFQHFKYKINFHLNCEYDWQKHADWCYHQFGINLFKARLNKGMFSEDDHTVTFSFRNEDDMSWFLLYSGVDIQKAGKPKSEGNITSIYFSKYKITAIGNRTFPPRSGGGSKRWV